MPQIFTLPQLFNLKFTINHPRLRIRYLLLLDLLLIVVSCLLSYFVRLDTIDATSAYLRHSWPFILLVVGTRLSLYFVFHLYYRLWRYASLKEAYRITLTSSLASLFIYLANFELFPFISSATMDSRSIWFMEGVFSLVALAGSRILLRSILEGYRFRSSPLITRPHPQLLRTLIIGAGDAGAALARQLQQPQSKYHLVGFIDDNPLKHGFTLHNIPVLGDRHSIPTKVLQHQINQIIIALPSVPGREIREIAQICEQAGIKPRTLPSLHEMLQGQVELARVRNIGIEDLLRRDPIKTDIPAVTQLLQGKCVLVTGAGGSIGSELCRQILRCHPMRLVLLGHGENSIFEIYHELQRELTRLHWDDVQLHSAIADIRFPDRMNAVFEQYRPAIVFHAAAHKHVPLMEENPAEAVTNNIFGTKNVLAAAERVNVEHFVMISTDKAVNPTSIMGACKRSAEFLVHETALRTKKAYVAVRFGNVLGSRGSVVLTFKQQIANGDPITVTHPEMKRFFMTIPEAVQLVLQSAVIGKGGEVFLLDMGEQIKIVDLAKDLIQLAGLEVGRDIEIVFSGLRPGEKLYEELFTENENYTRTYHHKIFIAANASNFVPHDLNESIATLAVSAQKNDKVAIIRSLQNLIPEFKPPQIAKTVDEVKIEQKNEQRLSNLKLSDFTGISNLAVNS